MTFMMWPSVLTHDANTGLDRRYPILEITAVSPLPRMIIFNYVPEIVRSNEYLDTKCAILMLLLSN